MLVAALELVPRPAQRVWFSQCGVATPPFPVTEDDIRGLPSTRADHRRAKRKRVKKGIYLREKLYATSQDTRDCTTGGDDEEGEGVTVGPPRPSDAQRQPEQKRRRRLILDPRDEV
jgi:hypothetical protein